MSNIEYIPGGVLSKRKKAVKAREGSEAIIANGVTLAVEKPHSPHYIRDKFILRAWDDSGNLLLEMGFDRNHEEKKEKEARERSLDRLVEGVWERHTGGKSILS